MSKVIRYFREPVLVQRLLLWALWFVMLGSILDRITGLLG